MLPSSLPIVLDTPIKVASLPVIPILRMLGGGGRVIECDSVSREKWHRGKMAQLIKALAAKSHAWSLMLSTYIVGRDNQD